MERKLNHILLLVFLIILAGCNRALDLEVEDTITDNEFWGSASDFKLAANAFYPYLNTFEQIINRDLCADLLTGSTNNISNSTYTIPQSDAANWDTQWTRIRAINVFLQKAQAYPYPGEIKSLEGEAFFFRAYINWLLFQNYGAMPIVDRVVGLNDTLLYATQAPWTRYVDFMIDDLKKAVDRLPLESQIAQTDKGRISKGAAQSLLARIALFEGTWQKFRGNPQRAQEMLTIAVDYARQVMESKEYQLFYDERLSDSRITGETINTSYRYLFILENPQSNPVGITKSANKEYVLANRYDDKLRIMNYNLSHALVTSAFSPDQKLLNLYLCRDGLPVSISPFFQGDSSWCSQFANRDPRMIQSLKVPGVKYWKYGVQGRVNWTGDSLDLSTALITNPSIGQVTMTGFSSLKFITERNVALYYESQDCSIIRYAEVLLNYAEAQYELNGNISDENLNASINLLRDRVGMAHLTNSLVNDHHLDMREEIRRERTVELYCEGFRYDDLRRWKTAETEMSQAILGARITGTPFAQTDTFPDKSMYIPPVTSGKLNADGYYIVEPAENRTFLPKHYLRPIPSVEVRITRLKQNPGWE
ncbi:RagB/SusD family nutrient uptake outer membrane protein [Parabacteroides sp. FAFU027]|uniref:RagB/SusD family nutrient uptake outer membrane protein n=1 Tax=Parabacteroides sp. FAFU027 TaxID=2922715 RepID=UPI001FAFB7AE|nr:RagB/SusD family nutrient uptake outer membrane protein [Parabacteroides sp. FAFU027]